MTTRSCFLHLRDAAFLLGTALGLFATPAAAIVLPALDAGFVTEAGGSAKGDATVTAGAKYNYSAGFELHYGTGALGAPLAPGPTSPAAMPGHRCWC